MNTSRYNNSTNKWSAFYEYCGHESSGIQIIIHQNKKNFNQNLTCPSEHGGMGAFGIRFNICLWQLRRLNQRGLTERRRKLASKKNRKRSSSIFCRKKNSLNNLIILSNLFAKDWLHLNKLGACFPTRGSRVDVKWLECETHCVRRLRQCGQDMA